MDELEIIHTLAVFLEPEQITELRALNVNSATVSRCYRYDQIADMASQAVEVGQVASGVYFIPNPLKEIKPNCATDGDVARRRWIILDFDPVRSADVSATDEEKARAEEVCLKCREDLPRLGMGNSIFADSGNGYHLCLPFCCDNNDESKRKASGLLRFFSRAYSTPEVKVDTAVYNASRIIKLYGTISRKGPNTNERPHRHSRIIANDFSRISEPDRSGNEGNGISSDSDLRAEVPQPAHA